MKYTYKCEVYRDGELWKSNKITSKTLIDRLVNLSTYIGCGLDYKVTQYYPTTPSTPRYIITFKGSDNRLIQHLYYEL